MPSPMAKLINLMWSYIGSILIDETAPPVICLFPLASPSSVSLAEFHLLPCLASSSSRCILVVVVSLLNINSSLTVVKLFSKQKDSKICSIVPGHDHDHLLSLSLHTVIPIGGKIPGTKSSR